MDFAKAHWVKPNEASRVPRRAVVVDVQPIVDDSGDYRSHRWRCGTARFIHWTSKGNVKEVEVRYSDHSTLWRDISTFTRPRSRTVVYFLNLPYRIRLASGLLDLASEGWTPVRMRLSSRGSWSTWERQKVSLHLADIASILPVATDTLCRNALGRVGSLNAESDSTGWSDYSALVCEAASRFVIQYLEWLRTGVAGNWQVTGAGQSWAHWRHAHYTHRMLHHGNDEIMAVERESMYAGRAESIKWGKDLSAPVYEWDWANAYPRIARDNDVPTELLGATSRCSIRELLVLADKRAVMAECEITTDQPTVPTRHDGRILWPVGTFRSVLWDPEIRAAVAAGATIRPLRVWVYRREPALRQWANWTLNEVWAAEHGGVWWRGRVCKHWSRTLIGRFATHYKEWVPFCEVPWPEFAIGTMVDRSTGEVRETSQIGTTLYVAGDDVYSENACPQVTAYVMSLGRVKLWRVMQQVGWDNLLYVNTDSLVTNATGAKIIRSHAHDADYDGLTLKQAGRGYEIYGHQTAIIGTRRVLSGCPSNAQRVADDTWKGEIWESLECAVKGGDLDNVRVTAKSYRPKYSDSRRVRNDDGSTRPISLRCSGLSMA